MLLDRMLSSNVLALYLVQIGNYIIPLAVLPFLARTLGTNGFGELVIIQSILSYGLVFIDYGFQITATRKIAENAEDRFAVGQIFINILLARIFLTVFSVCFIIAAVYLFFRNLFLFEVLVSLVCIPLFNSFTTLWLFQGLQLMPVISILIFLSRLLTAILTVCFVRQDSDIGLALFCQAMGMLLPCIYCTWFFYKRFVFGVGINHYDFSFDNIRSELEDGWSIFQTAIFSALLTNMGIIVLGYTAGSAIAGGYAAIDRMGKGIATLLTPLTQSIFPILSNSFSANIASGVEDLKKYSKIIIPLSFMIALMICVANYYNIFDIILGDEFKNYTPAMYILAIWILFGVLNNIVGIQFLSLVNEQTFYARAFGISSLLSLAIFFTSKVFNFWSIPVGLTLGEGLLLCLLVYRARWKLREVS